MRCNYRSVDYSYSPQNPNFILTTHTLLRKLTYTLAGDSSPDTLSECVSPKTELTPATSPQT